ncbi:MAG: ATP-binding cassette domain-containing protein [Myxococcota bacterium]
MLVRIEDVGRSFGGRTLFADVGLTIHRNDRIGLVGPNGSGKTTLLNIVGGVEVPDNGRVTMPKNVKVGLLRQEIDTTRGSSVSEEVLSVFSELDAIERELRELERRMEDLAEHHSEVPADLATRYDVCRARFELGGGFEREARVERVLAGLGFDSERTARPLHTFSGGWLMRVELAKLLLSAPDVLLLDEPTNHLDLPSIQWFEETLTDYPGAVVIISHDRTFLRRHVNRVAELEAGGLTVFDGNFERYLSQKALRSEELIARKRTQDRKIAETERFIERFRAKATKAKQVQSRVKQLDKIERVEVENDKQKLMRLKIPKVVRAGESILKLEGIEKSYDETVVYTGVDLAVRRGDKIALVGPNGAGKSTLLRIAAGVLPFDAGDRTLGHNVTVAFFAQHQIEALDPRNNVLEELETAAQIDDIPRLRGQLGAFLFTGDDVKKKISVLSGGEKSRVALAKLLLRPANFLVLDEPTNHLDLVSREVLERALASYGGSLLLISHDRTFLNALVNRVVEVDHGTLVGYPGNYDDYLRRKSPASQPAAALTKLAGVNAPAQADETSTPTVAEAPAGLPMTKRERIAARAKAKERDRRYQRAVKRLTVVESEIREREEALEQLSWRLGDPEIHKDIELQREIESDRDELKNVVAQLYVEWERLAAEIESAEQVA